MFEKYEQTERARVDKQKERLWDDEANEFDTLGVFEKEKIDRPPSFFRKMGRVALDAAGIHPYLLEQRREKEAMAVALNEFRIEKEAKNAAEEKARMEREAEERRLEEERKNAEAERERKALENDMANARGWFDDWKYGGYKNQRAQEILEKELNSRLTTVDQLDDEVAAENPEVGRHTIEYEGVEVPVYDLKGLPFAMLNHTVTYRRVNWEDQNHIGSQTSKSLVEHPEIWAMRRDEVEKDPNFGTRSGNAKGDVISCSYINSEANINSRVANPSWIMEEPDLCYGFSHLEGDSLVAAVDGDGGTSNMGGRGRTNIRPASIDFLERVEKAGGTMYNELVLRRYSDNGVARKPDYIIAGDGRISKSMLKHAKFFNIPIVNIEYPVYYEKTQKKAKEILDSVGDKDDYSALADKMDALYGMSSFKHETMYAERLSDESITAFLEARKSEAKDPKYKNVDKLHKLEIEKRISFIENELRAMVADYQKKTAAGERYSTISSPNCESFIAFKLGENYNGDVWHVDFIRKGSKRRVESEIFLEPDDVVAESLDRQGATIRKFGAYERLVPLLEELEKAKNENSLVTVKPTIN